ncbi:MAG: glycosyltransferase [Alsobacter sp.]
MTVRPDFPLTGPAGANGPGEISGAFYRIGAMAVAGWARDARDPDRRLAVEIRVDGETLAVAMAESFVPEVRQRFGGDGCHGFVVVVDPTRLAGAQVLEAWIANTDLRLDVLPAEAEPEAYESAGRIAGDVSWTGALRLAGWAGDVTSPASALQVEVLVDGEVVRSLVPSRWREAEPGHVLASGRHGFDVLLPSRLADGTVHRVRVLAAGVELAGSPFVMLAHEQGLLALARDIDPDDRTGVLLRARLLDGLMPSSLPLADLAAWRERFPVEEPEPSFAMVAVLVVGDDDTGLSRTLKSLEAQSHPAWFAVCVEARDGSFAGAALVEAADEVQRGAADIVVVAPCGAVLDQHALGHLAAALEHPAAPGLVYSDSLVADEQGRSRASFKPAFDRTLMLARGYAADLFALPAAALAEAAAGADCGFALFLAAVRGAEGSGAPVGHLPQVLAQLPRPDPARQTDLLARAAELDLRLRGLPMTARPGSPTRNAAVDILAPEAVQAASVSLVVLAREEASAIPILSTLPGSGAGTEIDRIVVAVGDIPVPDESTLRVVRADGRHRVAVALNRAVSMARHDVVCLVDGELEPSDRDWLSRLCGFFGDPDVAAVSGIEATRDGLIVQAGYVLGPDFSVAPACADMLVGEGGPDGWLDAPRQASAVALSCLAIRRGDWEAVGGLDALDFPTAFHDVDLCLRLRASGRTVLVRPDVVMLQPAGRRPTDVAAGNRGSLVRRQRARLRERWGHVLAQDPAYNPNLALAEPLHEGLASPPRARTLRLSVGAGSGDPCWMTRKSMNAS